MKIYYYEGRCFLEAEEQGRAEYTTPPAAEEPKRPSELSLQISLFYSPDNKRSFDKCSSFPYFARGATQEA